MKIFGYWHSGELDNFLKKSIETTIKNNPYIEYKIYDEETGRKFLMDNFDIDVVRAYNILIPQAYKSDLLRYCLLYHYGGAYIDLKLILNPIDISFFINNEYHFAKSRKKKCLKWKMVENSFLYFKKNNNEKLKKIIDRIVDNVKRKDRTCHELYITSPLLIGEFFQDTNPTLKFTPQKTPRQFIYTYKGEDIIDNHLDGYYTKTHENYWTTWRKNKENTIFRNT